MGEVGYRICERFDPSRGAKWSRHIEWSGLRHLEECVTLDCALCPSVLPDLEGEDWDHLVYGHEIGDTLDDLEHLLRRVPLTDRTQVQAVIREPSRADVAGFRREGFSFEGYDLIDFWNISALRIRSGSRRPSGPPTSRPEVSSPTSRGRGSPAIGSSRATPTRITPGATCGPSGAWNPPDRLERAGRGRKTGAVLDARGDHASRREPVSRPHHLGLADHARQQVSTHPGLRPTCDPI